MFITKIRNRVNEINEVICLSYYHLVARLGDLDSIHLHLRGENQKYIKFIVLGHPRSGSTMLISTLRKHPQIVGFGEIFEQRKVGLSLRPLLWYY